MDNTQQDKDIESSERTTQTREGTGTRFKDASPEEVKSKVKEAVQKGVAAVAGALKGFSEEAKKENLAESSKQAIQKAGETTREVAGTARDELKETKRDLARPSSAGAMGMGGSQLETPPPEDRAPRPSAMGDVGITGGLSSAPREKDAPDARKQELGKKDEELVE